MMKKSVSKLLIVLLFLSCSLVHAVELQSRIIGGQPAAQDAWPATTGLLFTDVYNNSLAQGATTGEAQFNAQYCGGSLVATNWVLTAAHCLYNGEIPVTAADIMVVAGITDLLEPGQLRVVTNVVIHPDYVPLEFDSDIALLELSNNIVSPAETISLYTGDPLAGSDATVVGWGDMTNENGDFPDVLQEVVLQIESNTDCSNAAPGYGSNITDNMICASAAGKDSCAGDSGGPLMAIQSGVFRQLGIVSFGIECALPNIPGVYTRVDRFSTWINDILANGAPAVPGTSTGGGSSTEGIDPVTDVTPPSGSGLVPTGGGGGSMGWLLLPMLWISGRRWMMSCRV